MNPLFITAVAVLMTCSFFAIGAAQSNVNPDLSVIPRFLVETDDGGKLAEGKREFSLLDFSFEEMEIVVSSYLNPFAKADVVMTLPGPDLEEGKLGVEEVYATVVRGLPLDLNLRLGKYRVDYGKINLVHPHAWSFITQPLSQGRFLGEEGLNDLGLSASLLLPVEDAYVKLTIDVLRGSSIAEAAGIEDTTGGNPAYANSARLMGFFALGDESDLEIGLSSLTGIHDPYDRLRFWYVNSDFKYKYRLSSYTSLTLQGEVLFNTRNAARDAQWNIFTDALGNSVIKRINSFGFYLYGDYQFEKIYSIGSRYDWCQSPYSKEDRAEDVALFLGYYPVEETLGVRLQYQHTRMETPGEQQQVNAFALQVLFALGPHKVHPF